MLSVDSRRKARKLTSSAFDAVKALAARPDLRDGVKKFQIKGLDAKSGRIALVDVLRDQLVMTKSIPRINARSRAIDDSAAYAAITEAYDALKAELEEAAAVQLATLQPQGPQ